MKPSKPSTSVLTVVENEVKTRSEQHCLASQMTGSSRTLQNRPNLRGFSTVLAVLTRFFPGFRPQIRARNGPAAPINNQQLFQHLESSKSTILHSLSRNAQAQEVTREMVLREMLSM